MKNLLHTRVLEQTETRLDFRFIRREERESNRSIKVNAAARRDWKKNERN